MTDLKQEIVTKTTSSYHNLYLEVPIGNYKAISYIHEHGEVNSIEYTDTSVNLKFRLHEKYAPKLSHILGHELKKPSTV
jgi:50S ribosomal subunit-associated GTPase HflX